VAGDMEKPGSGNMAGAAVERCGEGGDFKIFYFLFFKDF
jgi:hypothetical protein